MRRGKYENIKKNWKRYCYCYRSVNNSCFTIVDYPIDYYSSKKKELKIETPNGIETMEYVEIGGIKQRIQIRGNDKNNPVILFVAGGPGDSFIGSSYTYQIPLEKDYTIVHWDQRNAGMTRYVNDVEEVEKTQSIEQSIEDCHEVVGYIKKKTGQEKVIVIGHSFGTILSNLYIQKYPEEVMAYVGIGVITNMMDANELTYQKTLEAVKKANSTEELQQLEQILPYPDNSLGKMISMRTVQMNYFYPDVEDNSLKTFLFSPNYTLRELFDSLQASKYIMAAINGDYEKAGEFLKPQGDLIETMFSYDIKDYPTEYSFPVIYMAGDMDYNTPGILAQEHFETIHAPYKEFITIKNAGHVVMMDQPQKFVESLSKALEKALK